MLILLCALLASEGPAAAPAPSPAPAVLPAEDIVLALRKARIAQDVGDRREEGKILEGLVAEHPEDPTSLAAALEFYRRDSPDSEAARTFRSKLLTALSRPGGVVPYPLLVDVAADPHVSTEELARISDLLHSQPGEGAEIVARLRLRIQLLDRLEKQDERLAETERLVTLDPDPTVLWALLFEYRAAGRWDDVLRTLDRLRADAPPDFGGWIRLEALAGLGRIDDLEREATALIAKMPKHGPPGAGKELRLAEGPNAQFFFPTIFRLVDEGRVEAASRLATRLSEATGGAEPVERLRIMLFGTPEERASFLAQAAERSLASADVSKIRADADQRLIAKDFVTARDLYRRARELDPKDVESDVYFWFNYGLSCVESASWEDADQAMTRAIALDPTLSRALAHRARARVMLKRIPEGIADAQAALVLDPKSRHACYAMYLAYNALGESTKAAEWLARFKTP